MTWQHQGRQTLEDREDHLESLINLLADFGASENDLERVRHVKPSNQDIGATHLAADEDEKHNLGLDHAVDETREQLRLVRTEVVMLGRETLEANGELDVTRSDNVLDLEVGELGVEAELLDDAGVLARRQLRVIFRLGTGDDHLATGEDQGGGLGLANAHDNGRETLRVVLQSWVRPSPTETQPLCCQSRPMRTSAFLACRAIVLRSKRQSRLTVATMFLRAVSPQSTLNSEQDSYWSVGVNPLTTPPGGAPGVVAGVAGVTPVPFAA